MSARLISLPFVTRKTLGRIALQLRLLLNSVNCYCFFTIDATGAITSWNKGAARMFGYERREIVGKHFSCFFPPEEIQTGQPAKLIQRAAQGPANDNGWQVRKDGTRFFAEGILTGFGHGSSRELGRQMHDVTRRHNEEDALLQTQKLESIGVLASGIAHDFNNLLSGIMSGVSLAMDILPADHPSCPPLALAAQASERAAALTHQLLAYAEKGKFVVTRFSLSVLIRNLLGLLQTSIAKSVKLELALEPGADWIEADASQIEQIVMNLVINGAEAIGPEGGILRVSTRTTAQQKQPGDNPAGTRVYMEVKDSGSGMSDATRARIFDPFFTTKMTGRGLGLAAVAGIVRAHKGTMEVESALGKGSTFRIWLPGVEPGVAAQAVPAAGLRSRHGTGTVLIADDEPAIRLVAKAILEHAGYKVLMAGNGREAVEVFRENAEALCAILLDMNMPFMGGEEASRRIREIRPDVPILISTGYSEAATRDLFALSSGVGFVQKPYKAAVLAEKIRAMSESGKTLAQL